MYLRRSVTCQVLSLVYALLGVARCIELSENCAPSDNITLFVSLGTNRTGHPVINARLEQPSNGEVWNLNTKLEFKKCDAGQTPRKVITIKLTGLPLKRSREPQANSFVPSPVGNRGQRLSQCDCSTPPPIAAGLVSKNDEDNEIGGIEHVTQIHQIHNERLVTPPPTRNSATPQTPRHLVSKYIPVEGVGFVRVEKQPSKWKDAQEKCAAENASLAVPKDALAARKLVKLFDFQVTGTPNPNMIWLGASDLQEEGKWVTTDGTPLNKASSIRWGVGEPTHKREENCLLFHKVLTVVADGSCNRVHPFACSIPF